MKRAEKPVSYIFPKNGNIGKVVKNTVFICFFQKIEEKTT
jgi:hypothetical protein